MSKEQLQGCECKWWKQLVQLKFDYKELEKRHNDSFEQFKQLKSENEELTKINKANAKSYEKHWYKLEKYKQTLAEIKEICNKTVCDYLQCSLNYNHSKDFECEKTSCNRAKRRKFILQILQKISEVTNE